MPTKKPYPKTFIKQVLNFYSENKDTRSMTSVSKKFNISIGTLYNWINKYFNEEHKITPIQDPVCKKEDRLLKEFSILVANRRKGGRPTFSIYRYGTQSELMKGFQALSGKHDEVVAYHKIPTIVENVKIIKLSL